MDVRTNRRHRVDIFFLRLADLFRLFHFVSPEKDMYTKSPQSQTESLKKQILLLGSGFGFHVDDLLAIVVTAVLADTVGELHLLAARALNDTGRRQLPVRATHTAAGL
jgi:hypothetical protein